MRKLLFTDLDGSLLDHHSYDFSPALPAIKQLTNQHIPWILTSSKTAAELIGIREQLDNAYPFIVENGAGVFWPNGAVDEYDLPDGAVLQKHGSSFQFVSLSTVSLRSMVELSQKLKKKFDFKFKGFSEMTSQEVAECTGLPLDEAVKAKQRHFSEPLLWKDTEANLSKFRAFIESHDLQVIKGGRFVHLMGKSNKGRALKFIESYYHSRWHETVETIALGDGENDVPLLEASDVAVVIRSPVNKAPRVNNLRKVMTEECGPVGWNRAVMDWLGCAPQSL